MLLHNEYIALNMIGLLLSLPSNEAHICRMYIATQRVHVHNNMYMICVFVVDFGT